SALEHVTARLSWRALGTSRAVAIAALIAVAVFGALHVLQPPPPQTVRALVAARDLAVGAVISNSDLKTVQVPPGLLPEAALLSKDDVTGETIAAPVPKGLVITSSALTGPSAYGAVPE